MSFADYWNEVLKACPPVREPPETKIVITIGALKIALENAFQTGMLVGNNNNLAELAKLLDPKDFA